ncbi:MAG: bifunctional YncE family protein/alkaline phosphatase family protein [Gemmatimonadetes bacterium]|nr:bifunctional YncE family protein/alkaline phosphatase family protein [Gemmatimonadota bacterium]
MSVNRHLRALAGAALLLGACRPSGGADAAPEVPGGPSRLPTGLTLDPAGPTTPLGSMPVTLLSAPGGERFVVVLSGWREQGFDVVERASGRVVQQVRQAAAFQGAAFAPDGRTLYVSGGNQDVVYRYGWANGAATLRDSLVLASKPAGRNGTRYPAGLAVSADGTQLYVAENLADSLAVIDLASARVVQRLGTERYPVQVLVGAQGTVYVSAWGGGTVSAFPRDGDRLAPGPRIAAGRHPSAMVLNAAGTRLFVASGSTDRIAVIDPGTRATITTLSDAPPSGPSEGSTPSGLALSDDGTRLFVAESDANAVAVFDLSAATAGAPKGAARDTLVGRIPTQWYPTAVAAIGDALHVVNGKGRGTVPNVKLPRLDFIGNREEVDGGHQYTLGQLTGSLMTVPLARATAAELAPFSARVVRANGWDTPRERRAAAAYPPITHVIYVVKENRSYDQVFADLPGGDGDTSLLFFPRARAPNQHALAERFGLYDRFFVNAEVSPDGHNWSMAAYVGDYPERTIPSQYSRRGRPYDYEGSNRERALADDDDDVASPSTGYLWDLAQRAGVSFRNFGEYAVPAGMYGTAKGEGYVGLKRFLKAHTSPRYPPYNTSIRDQVRADMWLEELGAWVAAGEMPRFQIVRLPNDHTTYARAGTPTPFAHMADNDYALGRMIEALSRTKFWGSTAVFVLEDDAQSGADHVDSHRSILQTISPWAKGGTWHRFANTTDVIATIEELLWLGSLSQFDHFGRPLREIWRDTPDLRPYTALVPITPLTELNPVQGPGARESRGFDLSREDAVPDEAGQRVLWQMLKPGVPYPGTRRVSSQELARTR